jgi:hypothetical protein
MGEGVVTESESINPTALDQELPESSQPKPENLFSYGRPTRPEFFVGREAEVASILSRLSSTKNRGGSFVHGMYGIGKTSLLNYLKSSRALEGHAKLSENKARFILVPGQIITSFVEQEYCSFVFEDLQFWLEELRGSAEQELPMLLELQKMVAGLLEITESGTPPTQRQLIEFFARLGKAGLLCVVLLDNLGVLFGRLDPDDPVFFVRLRALLQEPSQQGFSLVAASQKSPDELFRDAQWWGSRFDAGMEQIALKGLDESEVDRLIETVTIDCLFKQFERGLPGTPARSKRRPIDCLRRSLAAEEIHK